MTDARMDSLFLVPLCCWYRSSFFVALLSGSLEGEGKGRGVFCGQIGGGTAADNTLNSAIRHKKVSIVLGRLFAACMAHFKGESVSIAI